MTDHQRLAHVPLDELVAAVDERLRLRRAREAELALAVAIQELRGSSEGRP